MHDKISSILVGVAGEYYVAAELSRRGYIASITLRNTRGADILVSDEGLTRQLGIQVKTKQYKGKKWLLNKKAETLIADNLFYVFVMLKDDNERPDFYIVPSKDVAEYTKATHAVWLKTPRRDGKPHKDTPNREFRDEEDKYLEKWRLLGLD